MVDVGWCVGCAEALCGPIEAVALLFEVQDEEVGVVGIGVLRTV